MEEQTDPLVIVNMNRPTHPTLSYKPTKAEEIEADKEYDVKWAVFGKRKALLQENISKLYGRMLGQCTPALTADIKNRSDFLIRNASVDALLLVETILKVSAGVDRRANEYLIFYTKMNQGKTQTMVDYKAEFVQEVKVLELTGSDTLLLPFHMENLKDIGTTDKDADTTTIDLMAQVKDKTKHAVLGMWFVQ